MKYDHETNLIHTNRLILRPFTAADVDDVVRMCSDRGLYSMTLNLPWPYTAESAEGWIAAMPEHFAQRSCFEYAVTDAATGELYGCSGFSNNKSRVGELGYWFGREYWGRGYATEAARALIQFAFDNVGLHRVYARHFACNPASGRVMQKAGMSFEGTLKQHILKDGEYQDIVCYGVLNPNE